MTPTNSERAERAWQAIDGYADNDSLEECIIDLLTDIQHLCRQEEMSFSDCNKMALNHFIEEVGK